MLKRQSAQLTEHACLARTKATGPQPWLLDGASSLVLNSKGRCMVASSGGIDGLHFCSGMQLQRGK
jgi:hypothetical protein